MIDGSRRFNSGADLGCNLGESGRDIAAVIKGRSLDHLRSGLEVFINRISVDVTRNRTSVSSLFTLLSRAWVVSFAEPWGFCLFSLPRSAFAPSSCFGIFLSSTVVLFLPIHPNRLRLEKKKQRQIRAVNLPCNALECLYDGFKTMKRTSGSCLLCHWVTKA